MIIAWVWLKGVWLLLDRGEESWVVILFGSHFVRRLVWHALKRVHLCDFAIGRRYAPVSLVGLGSASRSFKGPLGLYDANASLIFMANWGVAYLRRALEFATLSTCF